MPDTLALRFRDLVAPTIERHQEVISHQHGYVWWGWWNKPAEQIPRETFASLREVIERDGSLQIYLLDSGEERLYRAKLTGIRDAPTKQPIPSPEPKCTPEYYHEREYRAWFRFTEFEQVEDPKAEIRRWSYSEVPEFSEAEEIEDFDGKRVFDIQEMLGRRHKTIWFLRQYRQGDPIQQVKLSAPSRSGPFLLQPMTGEGSYLLHLSDLHFHSENHAFALDTSSPKPTLFDALQADLEETCNGEPPAGVIVSGDFTWTGSEEEFGWARDFLARLRSAFDLKLDQFVLIPGNHDIRWSAESSDYDPEASVQRPPSEAEQNFRTFFSQFAKYNANEYLCMGRRFLLSNFVSVDVIGLNSSRLEQRHFAGYGYVQSSQLRHTIKKMKWADASPRTHYRLLVLHHHLLPVAPVEHFSSYDPRFSLTLDAADMLARSTKFGVDLILHGHQHQPFVATFNRGMTLSESTGRSIVVHGAGSVGVDRDHLGRVGKNCYSLLRFDDNGAGVELVVRATSEATSGFNQHWRCRLDRSPHGGLLAGGLSSD